MTREGQRPRRATIALATVIVLGLGMRTSVSALAPLASSLQLELGITAAVFGVLGTLPPLCFAASAIFAPRLISRWGVDTVLAMVAVATSLATVARSLSPDAGWMIATSALVYLFVGLENVLVPTMIKAYFPRVGPITAAYIALVAVSAALPPVLAPLFLASGSWRVSLAIWALIALVATAPCVVLGMRATRRGAEHRSSEHARPSRVTVMPVHRSRAAWSITIAMTVASVLGYFLFAWLPTVMTDRAGTAPFEASLLLALFAAIALPVYAVGPLIVTRSRHPWVLYLVSGTMFVIGLLGLLLAPAIAPAIWVVALGLGQMLYAIAMTLVTSRTESVAGAASLSGFMQAVAYTASAGGMAALSAVYATTGSWTFVLAALVTLSIVGAFAGIGLGRRTIEGDLKSR